MTEKDLLSNKDARLLSIKNTPVWKVPKFSSQPNQFTWCGRDARPAMVCIYDSWLNPDLMLEIIKDANEFPFFIKRTLLYSSPREKGGHIALYFKLKTEAFHYHKLQIGEDYPDACWEEMDGDEYARLAYMLPPKYELVNSPDISITTYRKTV